MTTKNVRPITTTQLIGFELPVNKKFFPLSHPSRAFKIDDWAKTYERIDDYAIRQVVASDSFILLNSDFEKEKTFAVVAHVFIKENLKGHGFEVVNIDTVSTIELDSYQTKFVGQILKESVVREYGRDIRRIKENYTDAETI